MPARSRSPINRRLALFAAAATFFSAAGAAILPARSATEAWSLGTAYAALALLAVSMILGPLNLLRRRSNPVHSALRRDVGICAGITAVIHTLLGLRVHMGGVLSRYFVLPDAATGAAKAFVAANYAGLMSAVVLLVLVLISNDVSISRMGLQRWKRFQRLAYAAAVAAVIHGLVYQLLEKRPAPLVTVVALVGVTIGTFQLRGFAVRRAGDSARTKERD